MAGRRRCPAGGGSVWGGEGELGVVLGSGASGASGASGVSGAAPGLCFPFTPAQYRAPHREGEGVPLGTGTRITIPALYQPGLLGAATAAEMAFSHLGESGYTRCENGAFWPFGKDSNRFEETKAIHHLFGLKRETRGNDLAKSGAHCPSTNYMGALE